MIFKFKNKRRHITHPEILIPIAGDKYPNLGISKIEIKTFSIIATNAHLKGVFVLLSAKNIVENIF